MSAAPGSPIRISPPTDWGDLTNQLNRAFTLLQGQFAAIMAALEKQGTQIAAVTPGNVATGSDAIIQGPVPGGPSPIPTYLTPHSIIIGEGSTPTKQITFNDGQTIIGATGGDPAAASLTGDGTFTANLGVAITGGPNSITISLNDSVQGWIVAMQAWAQGVQSWADTVSADLFISPPSPLPPNTGPN